MKKISKKQVLENIDFFKKLLVRVNKELETNNTEGIRSLKEYAMEGVKNWEQYFNGV